MDNETITRFCNSQKITNNNCVRIDFKKRNPVFGLLVKAYDYEDLRSKNFWRIVLNQNIETWNRTKSIDIAKIFNGAEFSKLSVVTSKEVI